jgi:hypothetical protein
VIRAEIKWLQLEALTGYQKLTGELQVRGLLRETLNDPEPHIRVRNVATEPLLPGAPRLSSVPDGLVNKAYIGLISPLEPEPATPGDEPQELQRQFALVQGTNFTVRAWAQFPPAADPNLHSDLLLRSRFFHLVDAAVGVVGADGVSWQRPDVWVNRDLLVALYLG